MRYVGALLVALAFWSAFGLATHAWIASDDVGFAHKAMLLSYELVRFPNFIQEVVRPWGGAVPLLSLGLALTITIAAIRVIVRPNDASPTERALLVIILVMIAAASASGPPRHETRYIFFLYPLMLLIATLTTFRAFEALRMPRTAVTAAAVTAVAALFAATEDFSISRLAHIDSANVNFRVGATRRETAHLLPRADVRAAADWLALHPQRGAVVINAFPSVDFYYPSFDFTYIDSRTARFEAYACRRGTRERWGNLPLLYEASAIELRLASGTPVRVVASAHDSAGMLRQFDKWNPQVAWRSLDGGVMILDFRPQPTRMNAVAKQARSPNLPGR